MNQKRFVLCSAAAVLALALACSKSSQSPSSPSVTENGSVDAAADGSTLKATKPTPISPINGAQPDSLTLTATKAEGKFDKSLRLSYQFQITNSSGAIQSSCTATVSGDGDTVSYTPSCGLEFDQPHTWKVRARYLDNVGPWSAEASFKTP